LGIFVAADGDERSTSVTDGVNELARNVR